MYYFLQTYYDLHLFRPSFYGQRLYKQSLLSCIEGNGGNKETRFREMDEMKCIFSDTQSNSARNREAYSLLHLKTAESDTKVQFSIDSGYKITPRKLFREVQV
jgi:hypothetical protein